MRALTVNVQWNHQPVAARLENVQVRQRLRQSAFFGKAVASRIVLHSPSWVACLTLADSVDTTALRKLAVQLKSGNPPPITLTGPIMAIQAIRLGTCWPENQCVEPLSILNCRPCADWVLMEAEPPVETEHPLHRQPPNTLSLESSEEDSVPIRIPYDWMGWLEQRNRQVRIALRLSVPRRRANVVEITTADEGLATRLLEDIRSRRVRRIRLNQAICQFKVTSVGWPQPISLPTAVQLLPR